MDSSDFTDILYGFVHRQLDSFWTQMQISIGDFIIFWSAVAANFEK